jgi:hypothetical protein
MAADPVVAYWAEIMRQTPFTPELMAQWKRVMDQGIEAWSRALSEVMATDEFAQLLGTSIEQWVAAQASISGNRVQPAAQSTPVAAVATQLTVLAAQLSRIEERLTQVEERIAGSIGSAAGESVVSESAAGESAARRSATPSASARMPRRGSRRRAA